MANPYLYPGLELAPLSIQRIVAAVPSSRWDEKTEADRFTFREAVAHLADWEPIMRDRIRTAAFEPGSEIVAYDEALLAERNGYASTDPKEEAAKLIRLRSETVRLLRSIPEDRWNNEAIHPERGPMTVADLTNLLLGHDHYHIEHLTQFLT